MANLANSRIQIAGIGPGDDCGDGGERLLGVKLVASGCIPRQDRGNVGLLGERASASPVGRRRVGRRIDVDARVGGERNVFGGV